MGSMLYPLSQQIADTIAAHGRDWAEFHYCHKRTGPRLSTLEWSILAPRGLVLEIEARTV